MKPKSVKICRILALSSPVVIFPVATAIVTRAIIRGLKPMGDGTYFLPGQPGAITVGDIMLGAMCPAAVATFIGAGGLIGLTYLITTILGDDD